MRTLYGSLLVPTLCIAVSILMFADVSHAKKGGNSDSKVKIDVRAELEPSDGSPEDDAKGKMRHQKEIRKDVIKKDEFKGDVKIRAYPASALGIVDETSAENADVRLILSRAGTDFAECRLVFDEIEGEDDDDDDDDDEETQAVFKIHVRMKKGTVKVTKGVCDVDMGTAGIQSGVPDALDGDLATATLVTGGTQTDFLQGTFEQH